jgi:hypothetical protein
MKFKEVLNKFLVSLGYLFIAILSGVIGFFLLKKKRRVNFEKPGDLIDSLPNADAVRKRIADFGTATGNSGRPGADDADSGGGVHNNGTGTGDSGVLTDWVGKAKRMDISGTSKVVRIRNSGSTEGADGSD